MRLAREEVKQAQRRNPMLRRDVPEDDSAERMCARIRANRTLLSSNARLEFDCVTGGITSVLHTRDRH